MQLFVPEAVRSAKTDNSKMFLEKIELLVYETGNRLVLEYFHWDEMLLTFSWIILLIFIVNVCKTKI